MTNKNSAPATTGNESATPKRNSSIPLLLIEWLAIGVVGGTLILVGVVR